MRCNPTRVLCLGDSHTFGYGVAPGLVWTALAGRSGALELINRGISGNTTGGMLVQLERLMDQTQPGAVLLMGGSNDILLSGSAVQAQSNMGAMGHIVAGRGLTPVIGIAPRACPPIRVDWSGLVDFARAEQTAESYRQWLRRLCQAFHFAAIDFDQGLACLAEEAERPSKDFYLDGLHMNELGHQGMAQIAKSALLRRKPG